MPPRILNLGIIRLKEYMVEFGLMLMCLLDLK